MHSFESLIAYLTFTKCSTVFFTQVNRIMKFMPASKTFNIKIAYSFYVAWKKACCIFLLTATFCQHYNNRCSTYTSDIHILTQNTHENNALKCECGCIALGSCHMKYGRNQGLRRPLESWGTDHIWSRDRWFTSCIKESWQLESDVCLFTHLRLGHTRPSCCFGKITSESIKSIGSGLKNFSHKSVSENDVHDSTINYMHHLLDILLCGLSKQTFTD